MKNNSAKISNETLKSQPNHHHSNSFKLQSLMYYGFKYLLYMNLKYEIKCQESGVEGVEAFSGGPCQHTCAQHPHPLWQALHQPKLDGMRPVSCGFVRDAQG